MVTSGVRRSSVSATHNAAFEVFSTSYVSSENQDACRNSKAMRTPRGTAGRKFFSSSTSAFRFGGSCDKPFDEVVSSPQPLDVGDDLVRFDCETEVIGCLVQPFLNGGFFQKLTKREIDFNRVELGGVMGQEFCLRQFWGIEIRFPAGISPARC